MSSQELAWLMDMLRNGPIDFSAPPAEMRPIFEGMLTSLPSDESVVTREREIGGVQGIWMDADSSKVLLYLHGGGYTIGSALAYRDLATSLARGAGMSLFSADYRLAPEHPYPAGLEDALAAYRGLLSEGYSAHEIAVAGDSAGGGLTLALLLSLRDEGQPMPSRALLLSPWTDMTMSGTSIVSKADADPNLKASEMMMAVKHYLGDQDPTMPTVSPVFADLAGLPPLLIEVGEAEILLSDSTRLAERAAIAGTDVQLHVWPGLPHVWALFAALLAEGREVIREAAAFLAGDN